ncbi:MAG: methyltransferase [Thermoplasmataceae archaeon]
MRIQYKGTVIEPCAGVYEPAEDTFLILDNVLPGRELLEIGCGTGIISVYFAKTGCKVTACDINGTAVECARKNAKENSVLVDFSESDLFSNISGQFDTIIFNPPYLPTSDDVEEGTQWNGGEDGFKVISPFLDEAKNHLSTNGEIYLVVSSLTDYQSLWSAYKGYVFEEVASKAFFFETIFLFRGLLKAQD